MYNRAKKGENNYTMIGKSDVLLRRLRDILRTEGLKTLVKRSFDFVRNWFFKCEYYYIYEHTIKDRNESDFLPRLGDFTFKMISTNKEADEVAEETGFDLRQRIVKGRERLNNNAIAFCFFVGNELAHIGWVALDDKAKKAVAPVPFKVAFSEGQACTGGTWTMPQERGKGLMTYSYFKRFGFLREKGFTTSRNAVVKSNIASQKAHAKFGPKVVAEARLLKLFSLTFYSEKKFVNTERPVDNI